MSIQIDKEQLLGWTTQTLWLQYTNPAYNKIEVKTLKAMLENEKIAYLAARLYFEPKLIENSQIVELELKPEITIIDEKGHSINHMEAISQIDLGLAEYLVQKICYPDFDKPPIIFLAFAPQKQERFLHNPIHEYRHIIEDTLKEAVCNVVIRTNVDIETLSQFLQEKEFKDRVAVLHYIGNTGSSELFQVKDGMINTQPLILQFLSSMKNLKLFFCHGCSSADEEKLKGSNIPTVIITTDTTIKMAAEISARFYELLASEVTIINAFELTHHLIIDSEGIQLEKNNKHWKFYTSETFNSSWSLKRRNSETRGMYLA